MATVTVEFSGKIEIDAQGWSDDTKLDQIKKQAQDEVKNWTMMVRKGTQGPQPIPNCKVTVTAVTIDV